MMYAYNNHILIDDFISIFIRFLKEFKIYSSYMFYYRERQIADLIDLHRSKIEAQEMMDAFVILGGVEEGYYHNKIEEIEKEIDEHKINSKMYYINKITKGFKEYVLNIYVKSSFNLYCINKKITDYFFDIITCSGNGVKYNHAKVEYYKELFFMYIEEKSINRLQLLIP